MCVCVCVCACVCVCLCVHVCLCFWLCDDFYLLVFSILLYVFSKHPKPLEALIGNVLILH